MAEQTSIAAVIFDLDGVLIETEQIWDQSRRELVAAEDGEWQDGATEAMMGMNGPEWSAYVRDNLGVQLPAEEINDRVLANIERHYKEKLPLLPGAVEAVNRLADRWRLGLASSSNRPAIDLALKLAGVSERFEVTVSSEEVGPGKPEPDVYLKVAEKMKVDPTACVAIEDSGNGIRSAANAQMAVIAIPNRAFPPERDALERAAEAIDSIEQLTPEVVESAGKSGRAAAR